MSGGARQLAVVVIGYRAPPQLVGAVRSLLDQEIPIEIVVVNSGGGDAGGLLCGAGLAVPIIDVEERLYAGGARNLGVEATTAPYVAFLAGDCRACAGWASARLARHLAGEAAVAGAMVNSHPRNLVACAAHLLLFMRRLPGLPAERALRYGASYDRGLFAEYGMFDPALRTGEDTEFHARLPERLRPVWEPRVRTIHLNETRLRRLLDDQYRRGFNYAAYSKRMGRPIHWSQSRALRETRTAAKLAVIGLRGQERIWAMLSLPLVWAATFFKIAGMRAANRSDDDSMDGMQ